MVEFDSAENAETAICEFFRVCLSVHNPSDHFAAKFTGYMYGGRPLGLTFVKYTNANGNEMEGQEATEGMTQDQMM